MRRQGLPLADIAVFYRTNALSRELERALRLANLPYELVGTLEFYERKEVKDLLAFLEYGERDLPVRLEENLAARAPRGQA